MEHKTSYQWYCARPKEHRNFKNLDGWNDVPIPQQERFWFYHRISQSDFNWRAAHTTCWPGRINYPFLYRVRCAHSDDSCRCDQVRISPRNMTG